MTREYDLVVYGATGFTGGLTAEYLAQVAPPNLRWAIAGRRRSALLELRKRLAAIDSRCAELALITARSEDPVGLRKMARSTRVVITTVGPYLLHGENLAAACAREGTHYADLTGEPEFVSGLLSRHDRTARAKGARLVVCCGFDSIPPDYGALFTVRELPTNVPIRLRGYVRAGGQLSGGTWQSALLATSRLRQAVRAQRALEPVQVEGRQVSALPARIHRVASLRRWACPWPTIDGQIVRRSAAGSTEYGPDFRYGHFVQVKNLPRMAIAGSAFGALTLAAQFSFTRKLLAGLRDSGEGPGEEERARGWFRISFIGRGGGREVRTAVSGGDPGYGDTAKMLAQAGLCLACDGERLPDRAGVLTPVLAMGDALFPRLEAAGIRFETAAV